MRDWLHLTGLTVSRRRAAGALGRELDVDPHDPWIGEGFRIARGVEDVDDDIGASLYFTDASALTPALGSPPTAIIGPIAWHLASQKH
jgi:hypothetical protein